MVAKLPNPDFNDRYTISLPKLSGDDDEGLKLVRPNVERHVELVNRFGTYLFREEHYDFPLSLPSGGMETKAYFIIGGALCVSTVQPVGCIVFCKEPQPPGWTLEWVWIHPYARGRGVLSSHWPSFKREFGEFHIQPPLSFGMKAFVEKQKVLQEAESKIKGVA